MLILGTVICDNPHQHYCKSCVCVPRFIVKLLAAVSRFDAGTVTPCVVGVSFSVNDLSLYECVKGS